MVGLMRMRGLPGVSDAGPPPALAHLSAREQQVAELVARGCSNDEIARELGITGGTVANHVEHVLVKLNFGSRAALAAWAVEQRVLATEERFLDTLEQLLRIDARGPDEGLANAARVLTETLAVEDVDLFVYRPGEDSLVATGDVETLLHRRQRLQGLSRLPLTQGGRLVDVFRTGAPYCTGHAEQDTEVRDGFTRGLGIRSVAAVPWRADDSGGVVVLQATQPDAFGEQELRCLRTVACCIGALVRWSEPGVRGNAGHRARRGGAGRGSARLPRMGQSAA